MASGQSDSPILDLLAKMNVAGVEASSLDAESLMLVRPAALVAVDAPPAIAPKAPSPIRGAPRRGR